MYKSKNEIEKKLKQVRYSQSLIRQYQGQLLANNGRDPSTGAHPLMVHLSALISQARSVIQYAYKEAKETGHLSEFDRFVAGSEIFKLFKRLRNCDIHEYPVGVCTTVYATAYFDMAGQSRDPMEPPPMQDVKLRGAAKGVQSDAKVVHTLLERVESTEHLIEELEQNGQVELAQAARAGQDLYAKIEFDGRKDICEICDIYVAELERFFAYGQANGFVS